MHRGIKAVLTAAAIRDEAMMAQQAFDEDTRELNAYLADLDEDFDDKSTDNDRT